ncbi:E3 ubiquitin-protein ligase sina [Diachasma alloeum]|uniref:E3 ubiquitin-protein ligase sina n=1 Tax=Diachasma alloeum TaxID=454923 RepID=UPI00073810C6|nr:E3 ubiquitin-protein ligase sina [Diachasma alloeum]
MDSSGMDVMTELRAHWCDDLEELLECPVCLDLLKGKVFQCIQGHDVCQYCKKSLDMCPVCKSAFSESRNWTVEKIVAKFEEIKLSLMEPDHDINKSVIRLKKSVATQTTESGGGAIIRRSSRIAGREKMNTKTTTGGKK